MFKNYYCIFILVCISLCILLLNHLQVIPDYWEQEWGENYCGLFHFHFWRFGKWIDVVIDDILPTIDNNIITTRAFAENEFWPALVEKAYAKLHGSYTNLREGELCDALVDFTGGVSEIVDFQAEQFLDIDEKRHQLWDMLNHELADHSITCFNVPMHLSSDFGARTELGLMKGHSYQVIDVKKVKIGETGLRNIFKGREKVFMVKLRNPREPDAIVNEDHQVVQTPPGSPDRYSEELKSITKSPNHNNNIVPIEAWTKKNNQKSVKNTFVRNCTLRSNKSNVKSSELSRSISNIRKASAVKVSKAIFPELEISSGSRKFDLSTTLFSRIRSRNTLWQNIHVSDIHRLGLMFRENEFWMPLEDIVVEFNELLICRFVTENIFAISLTEKKWRGVTLIGTWKSNKTSSADPNEMNFFNNPQYVTDVNCEMEILIQLLQFHEENIETTNHFLNVLIGFHVIKVEENRTTRIHKMWPHCLIVISGDHRRKREVNYRGHLLPGRYIIIPSIFKSTYAANFALRVFAKNNISLKLLTLDLPKTLMPCSCFLPEIEWVSVITINNAECLVKPQTWGSDLSPYCVLCCEGDKVKTTVSHNNSEPTWNLSFIFFRKHIKKHILLQVYSHNTIWPNILIGECELPALINHSPSRLTVNLRVKNKSKNVDDDEQISMGIVHLTILTDDNLLAL